MLYEPSTESEVTEAADAIQVSKTTFRWWLPVTTEYIMRDPGCSKVSTEDAGRRLRARRYTWNGIVTSMLCYKAPESVGRAICTMCLCLHLVARRDLFGRGAAADTYIFTATTYYSTYPGCAACIFIRRAGATCNSTRLQTNELTSTFSRCQQGTAFACP